MILSDREIQAALRDRILLIDPPPDERLYTSTALDLTLDSVLLRWHEPGNHPSGQPIKLYPHRAGFNIKALMTDPGYSARVPIDPKAGFELGPSSSSSVTHSRRSTYRIAPGSRRGSRARAASPGSELACM